MPRRGMSRPIHSGAECQWARMASFLCGIGAVDIECGIGFGITKALGLLHSSVIIGPLLLPFA